MPKNTWDGYSPRMHPRPFNNGALQPEKPFMMISHPIGAPTFQTSLRAHQPQSQLAWFTLHRTIPVSRYRLVFKGAYLTRAQFT